MPGMRGRELIPQLKTIRPDYYIILCTESEGVSEAMARSWGADMFLPKPVDPLLLAATLRALQRQPEEFLV